MQLTINGEIHTVADNPDEPLLWVLRDELGLTGTKFGCGIGLCGACSVLVDGQVTRACTTPLAAVDGAEITTIEGLHQGEMLHPVQQAFIDAQVPQCGWCMSGQIITAVGLLEQNPAPSQEEITAAMEQNYCRCGCYVRIRSAVAAAGAQMTAAGVGFTDGEGQA